MTATTPATIHTLTCNRCMFLAGRPGRLPAASNRLELARVHEAVEAGHRVTVWDSPTSQIPRSFWTKEPLS